MTRRSEAAALTTEEDGGEVRIDLSIALFARRRTKLFQEFQVSNTVGLPGTPFGIELAEGS